jgi:dihydrodipicolinate reductase
MDHATGKPDAPSGTTRELAEELASISQNQILVHILAHAMGNGLASVEPKTYGVLS